MSLEKSPAPFIYQGRIIGTGLVDGTCCLTAKIGGALANRASSFAFGLHYLSLLHQKNASQLIAPVCCRSISDASHLAIAQREALPRATQRVASSDDEMRLHYPQ